MEERVAEGRERRCPRVRRFKRASEFDEKVSNLVPPPVFA
jgi:hypothetical protein